MYPSVLIMLCTLTAPPDIWPSFLGQGASRIDFETIPLNWSPTENIAWQAKLPGKGQSSPIIWNDRVFVTAIEGSMKDQCHLVALSLVDGRELWRDTSEASQTVRSNYFQSRSAPTPAVDANRVYAFFETGNVIATDHLGNRIWSRSLTEDYGAFESTIGLASSPALVNDVLVILIDHEGPSYLLGLDAKSGQTRWKTDRSSRTSYASPAVVPVAGRPQIVCSSSGSVDGFDPETGEQLWTFEDNVGGNRAGAALAIADGLFAVGASPGMHNEREEQAKKTNFVMQVESIDGKYVPKVVWRTEDAMPAFNSPMVHNGYAYWVNRSGVVYCYDAKSGRNHYTKRTNGVCWVTPVGLGNRIYLFSKDGMTTVLASGPEYQVLAENMLWDPDKVGRDAIGRNRDSGTHQQHGGSPESTASSAPERNAGNDKPAAEPAEAKTSDSNHRSKEGSDPTEQAGQGRQRPANGDAAGKPQMTGKEQEEARARGENRFADPVQYGVAIVNGSLVIRTGEVVYCVRSATPAITTK